MSQVLIKDGKIVLPLGYASLGDVIDAISANIPTPYNYECIAHLFLYVNRDACKISLQEVLNEGGCEYLCDPSLDPRKYWSATQLVRSDLVVCKYTIESMRQLELFNG